ncbi:alanine racemase [Bacillus cereus]
MKLQTVFKRKVQIQVKIDTGMGSYRFTRRRVKPFFRRIKPYGYVEVVGIFTHYSTADEIDKSYTNMQTSLFEKSC